MIRAVGECEVLDEGKRGIRVVFDLGWAGAWSWWWGLDWPFERS